MVDNARQCFSQATSNELKIEVRPFNKSLKAVRWIVEVQTGGTDGVSAKREQALNPSTGPAKAITGKQHLNHTSSVDDDNWFQEVKKDSDL